MQAVSTVRDAIAGTTARTSPEGIIKYYALWSAGAGLVPVPLIDLAVVGGIQLKMIAELAKHYGTTFSEARGKALIGALIGTVAPIGIAEGVSGLVVSMLKAIPVVGPLAVAVLAPGVAWASTYAVGKVFAQHFATGGSMLDFDPEKMREHYRKEFEDAKSADTAAPAVN